MSFHDILAKPVQIMREILDLESEFESPSLASQFVAIKHQMEKIQEQLRESNRISHEKDLVIAKLQRTMAAKAQPRAAAPASVRQPDDKPVQAPPVREPEQARGLQTEPNEEIRLPAVASYEAAAQHARSVRPCPAARMAVSSAPDAAEPRPSVQAPTRTKAKRAKPTRTRVAAGKTSTATPTAAEPKKATRAGKSTAAAGAKPTRTRVATRKAGTTTAAKPKKTTRTTKSATTEKAKSTRTRTATKKATAGTKAKTTAQRKRPSRASKK